MAADDIKDKPGQRTRRAPKPMTVCSSRRRVEKAKGEKAAQGHQRSGTHSRKPASTTESVVRRWQGNAQEGAGEFRRRHDIGGKENVREGQDGELNGHPSKDGGRTGQVPTRAQIRQVYESSAQGD